MQYASTYLTQTCVSRFVRRGDRAAPAGTGVRDPVRHSARESPAVGADARRGRDARPAATNLALAFSEPTRAPVATVRHSVLQRHLTLWRFVLVLGGGMVVMFGSDALGFHEAGSVGCITTALIAAAGWRALESPLSVVSYSDIGQETTLLSLWFSLLTSIRDELLRLTSPYYLLPSRSTYTHAREPKVRFDHCECQPRFLTCLQHEVEKMFEMVWSVFEPIMFSLIGADINTTVLDGGMVGLAVGCILISLLVTVQYRHSLCTVSKMFREYGMLHKMTVRSRSSKI